MKSILLLNLQLSFLSFFLKPLRNIFIFTSICFSVATFTIIIMTLNSIRISIISEFTKGFNLNTFQLIPQLGETIPENLVERLKKISGVKSVKRLIVDTQNPVSITTTKGTHFLPITATEKGVEGLFSEAKLDSDTPLIKNSASCALISTNLKETLFGKNKALGKKLRLISVGQPIELTVCKITTLSQLPVKDVIIIPLDKYYKLAGDARQHGYSMLFVETISIDSMHSVASRVYKNVLAKSFSSVNINFPYDILQEILKPLNTIKKAGVFFSFALLLSICIGILCVMYISISERKVEIGICRAVGATKADIFLQFMIEAAILSIASCVSGIFLGIILSKLLTVNISPEVESHITVLPIISVFVITFLATLLFSILPALHSAQIDPANAVRNL